MRVRAQSLVRWTLLATALSVTAQAQGQGVARRALGALEQLPLLEVGPDGETSSLRLASVQPGPLILYFYGEGCASCAEHLVYLQRLQRVASGYRQLRILAVAVRFEARARPPALASREVISVIDPGGKLWRGLHALPAVDSPPGARAETPVLPLTVFVGRWLLRSHGTTRLPIDQFVTRRTLLLNALLHRAPALPEIDIEDEQALQTFDWTPRPKTADAGVTAR